MAFSIVERPEARYKIIYGRHDRITPASELPSQFDALFLEVGSLRYSEAKIGDGVVLKKVDQYLQIVESTQEKETKIYFGDVPFKQFPYRVKIGKINFLPDWSIAIRGVEWYAGLGLTILLAREIDQKKKISRRDFLRRIGKGTVAVWGMSWVSKLGTVFFKEGQEVSRILEKIISAEDPLHPEDLTTWFRNAVMAKKLIAIGKKEQAEHNHKVEIAIVFGSGHTGLVDFLRRGEETCERVVRLYPKWFLKAMIAESNLDYISLIIGAEFNPQYGLWVITDRFFDEGLYYSVNKEQEYLNPRKEIR